MKATQPLFKGAWMYRYRAVDSQGKTLEFLLSATRDAQAAKRFFAQALHAIHTVTPRVITVDTNAADPKALKEMQAAGDLAVSCELRQRKDLNNLIEQDHRAHQTTGQTRVGLLARSRQQARTFQGYGATNMMRKGQMQGVRKGESLSQARFIAERFGVVI